MSPPTLAVRVDELAATCPMSKWPATGQDPACCRWCGERVAWAETPSEDKASVWCSLTCRRSFWANHSWKAAKEEAKKRARRRCERCGAPATATHQVHHRHGPTPGGRTRLASCDHHQAGLVLLCRTCHANEHHGGPARAGGGS